MKSFKLFMEDCGCEDCSSNELFDHVIVEAEYQGRKVDLNNPFRLPSGSKKKFGVYAKNDKGNIVKVTFGDPNMEIKRDDPKRRASFRARHGCDKDPGPKWKAKYWSCYQWRGGAKVDEENPCWDGYKQVGMKKGRNGNMVPNCVPEETVKRLTGKAQEREYVKDIAHAMRGKGHENLKKYADEFEKAALKSLDPEKELKKILPTIKDGQLYNLLNMGESVSGAEKQPFVSKAGAGEFGTDKAKKTYLKDSPHAKIEKLTKSYVSEGKLKDMFTLHKKGMSPKEIAKKFDLTLEGNKKPIMIAAMGSGKNKTYPIEYLAQLIEMTFETTNAPMILNYMPNQKMEINRLIKMLKPKTKKAIQNSLTPNSLRDYIVTVSQCQAVIGNEGGAINIAKGLSKPTFAIFSPIIDPYGWHTEVKNKTMAVHLVDCLLYTSPSPRDATLSRMPSSA